MAATLATPSITAAMRSPRRREIGHYACAMRIVTAGRCNLFLGAMVLLLGSCGTSSSKPAALPATTTSKVHALTFALRPVEQTSSPPCASTLVPGTAAVHGCYKLAASILGLTDVGSAAAVTNQNSGQWQVDLTVTNAAAPRFDKAMRQSVGREVAIVIDGEVVAAPIVNAGIVGKHVTITGNFDKQTAERIAAGLTKPPPPNPRQHATTCATGDLSAWASPDQVPQYRRLTEPGTYWFGRVHLAPPPDDAHPTSSLAQAWGAPLSGSMYSAAIYDIVLADWTSDSRIVMESQGRPVAHEHVLAWVVIGKHVPVAASDVDYPTHTVPGVPCYFGTSIAAVNAMTGEQIADSYDYSG